jgi:hypothetical protein
MALKDPVVFGLNLDRAETDTRESDIRGGKRLIRFGRILMKGVSEREVWESSRETPSNGM